MRWIKTTILITLTLVAISANADTLRQDSIGTTAVFTIDAQEWLDKVGIEDTTRARGPYISDSCVVGDHQLPIPFVRDQLVGRPLAFFSMRDVVLELGDKRQEEFPKDILVAFDTLSRHVVYCSCSMDIRWPEYHYSEPSAELAKRQLQLLGEEYISLPDTLPSLSILSALGRCDGYPLFSQNLSIYYVTYSRLGSTPVPAWVINMRGLAPWLITQRAHYSNTFRRIVVDALSGEYLGMGATNVPYPLLEPDSLDPLRW